MRALWGWEGGTCEEGRGGLGLLFLPLIPSVLPPADVQKESKENQWLGVSVRSQGPGGKIVVSTISFFLTFDIYHFYRKRREILFLKRGKNSLTLNSNIMVMGTTSCDALQEC